MLSLTDWIKQNNLPDPGSSEANRAMSRVGASDILVGMLAWGAEDDDLLGLWTGDNVLVRVTRTEEGNFALSVSGTRVRLVNRFNDTSEALRTISLFYHYGSVGWLYQNGFDLFQSGISE